MALDEEVMPRVSWSYPDPTSSFAALRDYLAVYAVPFDRCLVDGEVATARPARSYRGWITSRVAGPFKDLPGSDGW